MNAHDIAPLNGCTYMLTVLYEKHQYVSNQCMSANGKSHSQSQTKFLFVTTLEMDNFNYMNVYFINSQLVLGRPRGSFIREAYICSPLNWFSLEPIYGPQKNFFSIRKSLFPTEYMDPRQ